MSYSIREAKAERTLDIALARATYDWETLEKFAQLEAKEDNMEFAEALLAEAEELKNIPAYDQERDEALNQIAQGTW